jgi:hypothetical protein
MIVWCLRLIVGHKCGHTGQPICAVLMGSFWRCIAMHCMVIGQIHASHNGVESYLNEYAYFYATEFKKKSSLLHTILSTVKLHVLAGLV